MSTYQKPAMRILPDISAETKAFWSGGANGELLIYRCAECDGLIHPPTPACYHCQSTNVGPKPVSGRSTVIARTVNAHTFNPAMPAPFSIAVVELEEDPNTRLTTNIVGCDPYDVEIGMKVQVEFEQYDDVWVPVFRPVGK